MASSTKTFRDNDDHQKRPVQAVEAVVCTGVNSTTSSREEHAAPVAAAEEEALLEAATSPLARAEAEEAVAAARAMTRRTFEARAEVDTEAREDAAPGTQDGVQG